MAKLKKVILLLETSREFGREILKGISRYARLHGPWSFYSEARGLKSAIPRLTNWNADGIIMRNSVISNELINLNLPAILVLHDPKRPNQLPAVLTDGKTIAKLASEHLLNRGLKHFAYCGFDNFVWSNERKKYFKEILNDAGFHVNVYNQPKQRKFKSWENEQILMRDWLISLPKPVGILACNDDRGQHVLEACKSADIKVPEEAAVMGVDNDSIICGICDPPLTSVALNLDAAGYACGELLDRLMNGKPMQKQEIMVSATHVVKRQSTDILSIDDSDVSEAIRFIRLSAKNKIRVNDVVAQTCLSRRSLENRFRKIIHRSIQEEIRRTRVELIAQMLIETDLTVSEITNLFSFTDAEHISRYFRKEKGMGLREFRKLNRKC